MKSRRTAILHYTAPPVVGGVEAVIGAHTQAFRSAGFPVAVFSGQGEAAALADGVELEVIPELDSQHPQVLEISAALQQGQVPEGFEGMRQALIETLRPRLESFDLVLVHNIFTKHFNLPLTAALLDLAGENPKQRWLAWCHDFSWSSPNSSRFMHPGYPWDLLKTPHPRLKYVTVSEHRQAELAALLQIPPQAIEVVYNGVDPCIWFGLSSEGWELVNRMDLLSGDVILLMPLRVTRAKNIEMAEQVLAEIKALGYEPRLVITGPPDPHSPDSLSYYQSLQVLRHELGLDRQMRFVFDSGPEPQATHEISQRVVADLVRISDMVFLPSHREGFGMPVLEAGLLGVPVVASEHVPAALEIGGTNVYLYDRHAKPSEIAKLILHEALNNKASRFRRRIRQEFTWDAIFRHRIMPYLCDDL